MPEPGENERPWPEVAEEVLLPDVDAALVRHWNEADAERRHHEKARKTMANLVYTLGIPAGFLAATAGSTALAGHPRG